MQNADHRPSISRWYAYLLNIFFGGIAMSYVQFFW